MEEKGDAANTIMRAGSHVAYTEVLYMPSFYMRHLQTAFTSSNANPIEILKNMGGEHNWTSEMMDILSDIRKCSSTGMAGELYYVGKAYELMASLIAMGTRRLPKKSEDYEHILRVIAFMDAHYTEDVRQGELVKISRMSSTKLKNLFRQFTGCTITDYLQSKKADHAAHLLADTEMTVEQIAKQVGFGTATGFSTSFRKQSGISPTEYRKRMRISCMKNPSQAENLRFDEM